MGRWIALAVSLVELACYWWMISGAKYVYRPWGILGIFVALALVWFPVEMGSIIEKRYPETSVDREILEAIGRFVGWGLLLTYGAVMSYALMLRR